MKILYFLLLLYLGFCFEYILHFNYYDTRISLLSKLPPQAQATIIVEHDPSQMEAVSDFLLIISNEELDSSTLPDLKGIYLQKKINRKTLASQSQGKSRRLEEVLPIKYLWDQNKKGKGVKLGILDSGINSADLSKILIEGCINFTNDLDCEDSTGHGTFMASLISSTQDGCLGIAPESTLYILKVFEDSEESYTSWFLEAFNYAIQHDIKILSLSTGGIDFSDTPFVVKIKELVENGITIISAAGNDGPGFGTLSNPGDQPEVIGVGGLDESGEKVADFSSRGPTLWEMRGGMGRFKPDIVTYASNIRGYVGGKCSSSSGTSVATPIVAGSLALIYNETYSPGLIKQALIHSAEKLPKFSIFEQGAGKLDILNAEEYFQKPKNISSFPPNFSNNDEYFYPYNLQGLHADGSALILNFTIFHPNESSAALSLYSIEKSSYSLEINIEIANFSAYTASVGVFVFLNHYHADSLHATINLQSDDFNLSIPLNFKTSLVPEKEFRVLWDLSHNLKYPENGIVIRDEEEDNYLFDWRGDHPFTNHLQLYDYIVSLGYTVDFLYTDFSCVKSNLYSTYLIIDPELPFTDYEIKKIRYDVDISGISLIIFADWGDHKSLSNQLKKANLTSGIPGSNIFTINELLSPYFMEFGASRSYSGDGFYTSKHFSFMQGSEITRFPADGYLISQSFIDPKTSKSREMGVIGLIDFDVSRIAIVGDSSCLNPDLSNYDCLWLMEELLEFTAQGNSVVDNWFKLPYDYDIHIEEDDYVTWVYPAPISEERVRNLKSLGIEEEKVVNHETEWHEMTQKKLRTWSPFRPDADNIDLVKVVQFIVSGILILLLGVLYFSRKKPVQHPLRRLKPISVASV
ncbi:MBTPS1 [Blepharisma stoltei]|uniref:subtilisin n=1 Tax=Blepharisma stoltei TaxID=1481888 RepID=A0AAU9J839_9CILI|nr:unnamed protein product [Blepharisma stoltei]